MNTEALKLLLIEDTPSDAALFIDQIQNQLGADCEIEWRTRLSEAMAWLEAGNRPDQIWLDPGLPDLGQQNVGRALAALKKFVAAGELRLLSATIAPGVATQAAKYNVKILQKDELISRDSEILGVVRELFAKRTSSGGATVRIEQARLEGALAKLEYQVSQNLERLNRLEQAIDRLSTLSFEINSVKAALNEIPQLRAQIEQSQAGQQIRLKRIDALQAIMIAVISGAVAIGTVTIPQILDHSPEQPSQPEQP